MSTHMGEVREVLREAGQPLAKPDILSRCESLRTMQQLHRAIHQLGSAGEVERTEDGQGWRLVTDAALPPEPARREPPAHAPARLRAALAAAGFQVPATVMAELLDAQRQDTAAWLAAAHDDDGPPIPDWLQPYARDAKLFSDAFGAGADTPTSAEAAHSTALDAEPAAVAVTRAPPPRTGHALDTPPLRIPTDRRRDPTLAALEQVHEIASEALQRYVARLADARLDALLALAEATGAAIDRYQEALADE